MGFPGSPHTELPARDGRPHGGVARNAKAPNCSHFVDWTKTDDSITWTVDVLAAGSYEAVLWYTCPEADAGSSVTLSCGASSVTATIQPARGHEDSRRDRRRRAAAGARAGRPVIPVAHDPAGTHTSIMLPSPRPRRSTLLP